MDLHLTQASSDRGRSRSRDQDGRIYFVTEEIYYDLHGTSWLTRCYIVDTVTLHFKLSLLTYFGSVRFTH